MKIGVISDTHGSVSCWRKAVSNHFADVDIIIHAGDVLYHGPRNPLPDEYNPSVLAEQINNCPTPVVFARGNCDADVDQLLIKYPIQAPYAFMQFGKLRVLVVHGDKYSPAGGESKFDGLAELGAKYKAQVVIFGHIHLPVLENINNVVVLNPGSASLPKESQPPTIAIINDQGVAIYNLENNECIKSYQWEE